MVVRLTLSAVDRRATVSRALHVLEAAGFLIRQRRFARVEGEGAAAR